MKIYTGMKIEGNKVIYVRYPGGSKVLLPQHIKHKGESGEASYDWGKSNVDSLNTSFSLLINAFGHEFCDTDACFCFNERVVESYENFNAEFVAKLDENYWKFTQADLCDWVFDFLGSEFKEKINKDKELLTTS